MNDDVLYASAPVRPVTEILATGTVKLSLDAFIEVAARVIYDTADQILRLGIPFDNQSPEGKAATYAAVKEMMQIPAAVRAEHTDDPASLLIIRALRRVLLDD